MGTHILSSEELLEAQAHIWNLTFQFVNSMSLKSAIQLGISDAIHEYGKPISLQNLAQSLSINPSKIPNLKRLMKILVRANLITQDAEGHYFLTPSSRLLLSSDPMTISSFPLLVLHKVHLDPWHDFGAWFRNDDLTAFETAHGKPVFEYFANDQRYSSFFNDVMASDARIISRMIVSEKYKHVFEGLKSMVDVGGGTGTMAKAVAENFEGINCIVFDLPHVVDGLVGSHNLEFVSGNMFESIPQADAVFMKWILHDWPDEYCVKLLKNCKEAIPAQGKIIIVDIVMDDEDDEKTSNTKHFFDEYIMVQCNGKQRTGKEYAELFSQAALTSFKISLLGGVRSIIEVFP